MITQRHYNNLTRFYFDALNSDQQKQLLEYDIYLSNERDKRAELEKQNQLNNKTEKKIFQTTFTIDEMKKFFDFFYKREFGKDFIYTSENKYTLDLLLMYFGRNLDFEKENENYSLKKGIGLIGGCGTGKTSIFKTFETLGKEYYYKHHSNIFCFRMENSNQIALEYKSDKEKRDLLRFVKGDRCFDDLGSEDLVFGGENLLKDVIETRYHNRIVNGKLFKTHFSTNLKTSELRDFYGDRVRDRLNETTNFILLKGESFRK